MKNLNQRPQTSEYGLYYQAYINKVETDNLNEALRRGKTTTLDFFTNLPEDKWDYRYAPEKWTVKEMLLHIIDAERVFAYRALRIGRSDETPLPGFDENTYAANSRANSRSPKSLLAEYETVREATLSLYQSFDETALKRIGTASNNPASPRAIGFIIAGHEIHHMGVIKERYL